MSYQKDRTDAMTCLAGHSLGCRACWLLGIIFSVVGAVAAATKTNLGLGTVPWLLLAIAAFVASLPACIAWAVGMHLHAIGAKGEKEE